MQRAQQAAAPLACPPAAAGKTSTALAIARQLYGPELMKSRVMELNASDERGINVVRQKVRQALEAGVETSRVQASRVQASRAAGLARLGVWCCKAMGHAHSETCGGGAHKQLNW
jgi:DNA polymerase III delta prime subunit